MNPLQTSNNDNISTVTDLDAALATEYTLVWTPKVIVRVSTIAVVILFTVLGNSILLAIIMCHRKLRRKRVNIFLVNLAVGDLMVCFVTMTTEILFVAFGEWVLGAIACKLIVYGQIVTLASATFLLTGMSVDRYQVIVKPLQIITGNLTIWRKVAVAWLLALVFATPQLLIFVQTDDGVYADGRVKHHCLSRGYTGEWQRKLYFTFLTTYILVIPAAIMSFCYINIIKVVWMRSDASGHPRKPKMRLTFTNRLSEESASDETHRVVKVERYHTRRLATSNNRLTLPRRLVSSGRRNVVKMTLSVIIGFLVCWTPYFVFSLIRIYSEYSIRLDIALSVAEIMAMMHSALNPILYGIFSTKTAWRECQHVYWWCCCSQPSLNPPDETLMSEDETIVSYPDSDDSSSNKCKWCLRRAHAVCLWCSHSTMVSSCCCSKKASDANDQLKTKSTGTNTSFRHAIFRQFRSVKRSTTPHASCNSHPIIEMNQLPRRSDHMREHAQPDIQRQTGSHISGPTSSSSGLERTWHAGYDAAGERRPLVAQNGVIGSSRSLNHLVRTRDYGEGCRYRSADRRTRPLSAPVDISSEQTSSTIIQNAHVKEDSVQYISSL